MRMGKSLLHVSRKCTLRRSLRELQFQQYEGAYGYDRKLSKRV